MFNLLPNIQKTELICLDATVFQALFETLVQKIKKENKVEHDPYLSTEEACQLLKCNDEILRKYWKEGYISRAKFSDKHVLYDRESIMAFIKKRTNGNKCPTHQRLQRRLLIEKFEPGLALVSLQGVELPYFEDKTHFSPYVLS